MDEIWQRYRTFFRPVLMGLGVFLLGLIVVHIITPDPEVAAGEANAAEARLRGLQEPGEKVAAVLSENADRYAASAKKLGEAIDPSAAGKDPIAHQVEQTLRAAFLRGGGGLAAFGGDAQALADATRECERLIRERTLLFRTGNPNVAFSALLADVWGVLRTRANRADMDIDAEVLGFQTVTSVSRADLPRRLANLTVVTRIADVAIRNGGVSLDDVRFDARPTYGPDAYMREWLVTVVLTGPTPCIEAVLDLLTDPRNPIPIGPATVAQPRRGKPSTGIVELTVTVDCVAVNPAASLDLKSEEEGT
jgi:hypothetical protein